MLPVAAELDVPSFSHRTISAFLEAGHLPEHLETIRAAYRRRRDTLLRTLQEHFPRGARWSRPSSGLSVWVELPEGITSAELLREAVAQENVAFTPGSVFATRGGAYSDRALRLSFGNNPPHRIEEGVQRLARILQTKLV
jgi:DNA-binding transcriptional MocR family regulator